MTPAWQAAFRIADRLGRPTERKAAIERLAAARSFDLTQVDTVIGETAEEILNAAGHQDLDVLATGFEIDLGPGVGMPFPSCWLEFEGGIAVLLETRDDASISATTWAATHGLPVGAPQSKFIAIDGSWLHYPEQPPSITSIAGDVAAAMRAGRDAEARGMMDRFLTGDRVFRVGMAAMPGALALAALALINSSHSRQDVRRPSWLVRDKLRRAGSPRLDEIAHVVVSLRVGERAEGDTAGPIRTTSPRALHWCRAHNRQKGDRIERIRAHWRGDPAFGVRLASYRLQPPPKNPGAGE